MKFVMFLLPLTLLLPLIAIAQFTRGDVELSLVGTAGSWKVDKIQPTFGEEIPAVTTQYIYLSLTCDFYIANRLSIEPEICMMAVDKKYPAQSFIGNLSYSYLIPDSKLALFLRSGIGFANAIQNPLSGNVPGYVAEKFDVDILNIGGGVKYFVGESVALRIELNYRKQTHTNLIPQDITVSNTSLLVGFSAFL